MLLLPSALALSSHEVEGEPDEVGSPQAVAPPRGGTQLVSEGGERPVHVGVSGTGAQRDDQAVCDPPASSGCAVAVPGVWVRACSQLHNESMLHSFTCGYDTRVLWNGETRKAGRMRQRQRHTRLTRRCLQCGRWPVRQCVW